MDKIQLSQDEYDIIVIGGGVVGCAILYKLSHYNLKCLLLEKESDVAEGISKANSGVIHAGFNVPEGSLKATLNIKGLNQIYGIAEYLSVPHKKTGKLVVSLDDEGKDYLERLKKQGEINGSPDLQIIDADRIKEIEPLANGKWALYSPHTGIITPYLYTIALAEFALLNGMRVELNSEVNKLERDNDFIKLSTNDHEYRTRWVINCAGLNSDVIASYAGIEDNKIFAYRGEYLITDKSDSIKLEVPVYPVPPKDGPGLGVHVTPTMEGNILLGPSAHYLDNPLDKSSTREVMKQLETEAYELMPQLRDLSFIRSFSGIRPKLVDPRGNVKFKDFHIEDSKAFPGLINLIGIESPGLTSSPAIADYVIDLISKKEVIVKKDQIVSPNKKNKRFAEMNDEERENAVRSDSAWGEMVCRCETVTRKEVEIALDNPLGVTTLDAIKRRTRCGMGRCQGGFCTSRIVEIMEQRNIAKEKITKRGNKTPLFYGRCK